MYVGHGSLHRLDEKKSIVFERKILCKIYSQKKRKTNAKLRAMFNEPDIVGILKSRKISWMINV